jgi:hypothetical protein
MRNARAGWLFAVVLAAAPGCITMGRPFDTQQVPSIIIGKTTRAEIEKQFGEPYRTGIESGDQTWTYLHYRLSVFGDQRTTDLYVRFNVDRTVKSYALNTNVPEDQVK